MTDVRSAAPIIYSFLKILDYAPDSNMIEHPYIPPCKKCGGNCCKYVAIEIDKPRTKSDFDHIRWYLFHRDINIFVDHSKKWHVEFKSRCESLLPRSSCNNYTDRPKICRDHGTEKGDCEYYASPYLHYFADNDQLEKYLDDNGIDWKFKRM